MLFLEAKNGFQQLNDAQKKQLAMGIDALEIGRETQHAVGNPGLKRAVAALKASDNPHIQQARISKKVVSQFFARILVLAQVGT